LQLPDSSGAVVYLFVDYPQVEHDPDEQPEQDDPDDPSEPPFSLDPAIPNVDIFLSGLAHLQCGQTTFLFPMTIASKSFLQRGQLYS